MKIILFSSTLQVEDLLCGEPDQQIEVGVEMFPPEPEDPAPLLGWEVRTLDAVKYPGHGPPTPCVFRVSADKGPDICPD